MSLDKNAPFIHTNDWYFFAVFCPVQPVSNGVLVSVYPSPHCVILPVFLFQTNSDHMFFKQWSQDKKKNGKPPCSPSLPALYLILSLHLSLPFPASQFIPSTTSMSHIFISLFSSVKPHLSLGNFYPTAAWGWLWLSMKCMMGNGVPAGRVRCDLLTHCQSERRWVKGRKCTVGRECKWMKSRYFLCAATLLRRSWEELQNLRIKAGGVR